MITTIVSKYKTEYFLRMLVLAAIGIISIVAITKKMIASGGSFFNWESTPPLFAAYAIIGWGMYVVMDPGNVRKLIITPDFIKVYYFIGRPATLKHTDIKSMGTYSSYDNPQPGTLTKSTQLQLELNNGKTIRFFEGQFTNFSEIKQALWEYRLAAFAPKGEPFDRAVSRSNRVLK